MSAVIRVGGFVHSLDSRDDRDDFFVVLEMDVRTTSGLAHKIALPGEHESMYRLVRMLVSADEEIARFVREAEAEAAKLRGEA